MEITTAKNVILKNLHIFSFHNFKIEINLIKNFFQKIEIHHIFPPYNKFKLKWINRIKKRLFFAIIFESDTFFV